MLVLALDTTGPDCSACLVKDGEVLAHMSEPLGRGHAERLAPMVVEVMAEANVRPDEIDRLSVCTGPGSFTGLRVALSYAKGFALPRRLPVLGLSRLDVARAAQPDALLLFDIRRGEMMVGQPDGTVRTMSTDAAEALAQTHAQIHAKTQAGPVLRDPELDMAALARLASAADPADHPPVPLYSRAPDAKLPGGVTP